MCKYELHVFENIHHDILLLNIPSEENSFEEFLQTYDTINRNKADNCIQRFQTYCEYYLNKFRSLKTIQIYLDRLFGNVRMLVMKTNIIIIFN
jgi:hypothetical protein